MQRAIETGGQAGLAYAASSEARRKKLRDELSAAEETTAMLRRDASRARRPRSARR